MNSILLAPCTMIDFPSVTPILESYADIFNIQQKRTILHQASKVLEEDPHNPTLYIAKHDSQNIAFLGFARDNQDPREFLLFNIVVRRGYQGQGVGTKLFQYGSTAIKNMGATSIRTYIKFTYPPATKNFYKKLGFIQRLDESYTGASDQDNILYVKELQ